MEGSNIMQKIRKLASKLQSDIDLISKQCLSSSDVNEARTSMKAEETSLRNDRNILV